MAGLLARFSNEEQAVIAARRVLTLGFSTIEGYSPVPSKKLQAVLGTERTWLAPLTLFAGLGGAIFAYGLQWYTQAVANPLNIGGRPNHAPLAFVAISFETAILFASAAAFFGALLLCGLPRLYQPLFDTKEIERSMIDGYLLMIETEKESPQTSELRLVLVDCGAESVETLTDKRAAQ